MVSLVSGSEREIPDIMMTRHACYLIAQNEDPRKDEIAFARSYFAVQTRKQLTLRDLPGSPPAILSSLFKPRQILCFRSFSRGSTRNTAAHYPPLTVAETALKPCLLERYRSSPSWQDRPGVHFSIADDSRCYLSISNSSNRSQVSRFISWSGEMHQTRRSPPVVMMKW